MFRRALIALSFLCVSSLYAQTTGAAEAPHRFDYPAEHFSIELPAKWSEIDSSTAGLVSAATQQLIPNAPALHFNHIYMSSNLTSHAVIVRLTSGRLSEAALRNLADAGDKVNGVLKNFLSGSVIQMARMGDLSYDPQRHVFLAAVQGASMVGGETRGIVAIYITKMGTIQVSCYAKTSEFASYEAECRQIAGSVTIDASIAGSGWVPLSELLGVGKEQANSTYRELVARVKSGDFSVDFRALRMACVKSDICQVKSNDGLAPMNLAGMEHRYGDAVEIAEKILGGNFVNIEAHLTLFQACSELKRPEQAKFHKDVMTALLRSILDAGDGKTEETAYEVISRRELILALTARGLQYIGDDVVSAQTINEGGHRYRRYEVRNVKTSANEVVFFNIDADPDTK